MPVVLILHGPNLNLLGTRQPEIYGTLTLDEINQRLVKAGKKEGMEIQSYQSNSEGGLIDALHKANSDAAGVIINPGGYTHTSVAIRDAVAAIGIPTIEVHLSNVYGREDFRKTSMVSSVCVGKIVGFGWLSYLLALQAFVEILGTSGPSR